MIILEPWVTSFQRHLVRRPFRVLASDLGCRTAPHCTLYGGLEATEGSDSSSGCGLRARMLSVLSTSWQQQHGPDRRRRCGNGAARVAEPAFAPARSPREALPALPLTPRPPRAAGAGEGSRAPRERGTPPRGGPGARGGPRGQWRGAEEGRPGPDAAGRGPRSAPGCWGSDGPGAPADEPRRESGHCSPSPEPRLS